VLYGAEKYVSCNPGQIYPVGTGSIEITLTHKASGQKSTKILQVLQNIVNPAASSNTPTTQKSNTPIDTYPPIAIIDFDGKVHDYYEQIDTYEFNCYTMTCSVNLSGERSYDPE
jgi:hypothetical protein